MQRIPASLFLVICTLSAEPVQAQENPLLSPPPGIVSPSDSVAAERGRMRTDMLRPAPGTDIAPTPDPMQARDLNERRLDADRLLRAQQEVVVPAAPGVTVPAPAIDPPEPRITHGRRKDKPSPVQSSPVPTRKPSTPDG